MRKISIVLIALITIGSLSYAQYKDIPYETKMKLKSNNLILGFINPKNFRLSHSFNLSYQTYGNASYSLASYTGTLAYKILDNLSISADVTMQYSPYANIGTTNSVLNKDFQNSLNGVSLSRVSLNYRPLKNMFINIEYINNKSNYFNNYYLNDYYFSRWSDF